MILAPKHPREEEINKEIESYNILDSLPERDYDDIVVLAAEICGVPMSFISLLHKDRQWFKSSYGIEVTEGPKAQAFCSHTILSDESLMEVSDATEDERFHDNPYVTGDLHLRFYAGVQLDSGNGLPLGTICVIDQEPKELNEEQKKSLKALANQVMNLLKLRKKEEELKEYVEKLEERNSHLESFAYVAAHDLKAPLRNIADIVKMFKKDYSAGIDDEGNMMLGFIETSADKLKLLVDGLLDYSRSETILSEQKSTISKQQIQNDLDSFFAGEKQVTLTVKSTLKEVKINKTAIDQILINLVSNAIKYSDKEETKIDISVTESPTLYSFSVKDNGAGIPAKKIDTIFNLFATVAPKDKFGKTGNGIGLATVKKIVEKLNGTVSVSSEEGKGSTFTFSISK